MEDTPSTFQVKVERALSDCRQVKNTSSQGGVLFLLISMIFISDVPKLLIGNGFVVEQFADDLQGLS